MQEQSLFIEALDKEDPVERAAYLARVCAGDPGLRRRIEKLLQRHQEADSFLESPAATCDEPLSERSGALIGPYKLLQEIGEGGMGTVYMAEQQDPVRRMVALKIIKPGMDSKQVIARFEAERQALALMDHPNIAKVLDAGTTPEVRGQKSEVGAETAKPGPVTSDLCSLTADSGRPYFVMELVKGVPITRFCDENRLTPRARLELFIPVCHALQHAHQKGIIHRDLKPSNVLVALYDDRPVPKVIDFGVAKATSQKLTERTLFTGFGSFIGTLEYMSPEQAKLNALDIDTRSDVYALGVLLYELLTGDTPLEHERLKETALDELLRTIREEEPPTPSTRLSRSGLALATISAWRGTEPAKLGQVLRGELDWIVMRCLEKDRTRRYETANSLARDLQHYLADEPVEACPPTAGYKLRKFARKHKRLLATAAAFSVLLLLGVAASSWQAVRATQAEAVAVVHEQQANANAAQAQKNEQEANQRRDEVQALNVQLQRTLYAAHMNLAQHAWEAAGIDRVRELLEQLRPKPGESDLRGFEWHYLYRLCHAEHLTLKGHTGAVLTVAYSPDGKRLFSASSDDTVKVWDAQTGQELLTIKAATGGLGGFNRVAFSPDGKRLASTPAGGGLAKVWDAQTGQELLTLKGHMFGASIVAFSPDGKRLASGGSVDNTMKVWDAQTGQELLTIKAPTVGLGGFESVAFSPDGKLLASVCRGPQKSDLTVWDAQTGLELFTLNATGRFNSLAFSPDGKRLASNNGGSGGGSPRSDPTELRLWDAQTGQELLTLKATGQFNSLAFSPDGKRLAGASSGPKAKGELKVWDAQTGEELITLLGHTGRVTRLAFSTDGKRLASASSDATVKVWPAQNLEGPHQLKVQNSSSVFSPDGKFLASTREDNSVMVWNAQTGQEQLTLKGDDRRVTRLAFSLDGKHLAIARSSPKGEAPGEVKVWDAQTGRELCNLKGHTGSNGSIVFSPDGKHLATADRLPKKIFEVKVWEAKTGQELFAVKGLPGGLGNPLIFSPDGKRLAIGSVDSEVKTIKVLDAQTGQEFFTVKGYIGSPGSAVYSPDGKRLAAGSSDGTRGVTVWDAQTGQELVTFKAHTAGARNCVAFSPDGKRLATASSGQTVKVWDAQTGQQLLTLKGHTAEVDQVAFSPDGKRLVSAGGGEVKVWDAQSGGQELLTLKGGSADFSPDGHWLLGTADGKVKIWDATPVSEKR